MNQPVDYVPDVIFSVFLGIIHISAFILIVFIYTFSEMYIFEINFTFIKTLT